MYELLIWTNEGTHVGGAHNNDKELNNCTKPNAFDYGTNGVCKSGT
jgi:hypothetical protein